MACQCGADGVGFVLGNTHRLFAEDVTAFFDCSEDLAGVILIVARHCDDGDLRVVDQVLGPRMAAHPGVARCDAAKFCLVQVAQRDQAAIGMTVECSCSCSPTPRPITPTPSGLPVIARSRGRWCRLRR